MLLDAIVIGSVVVFVRRLVAKLRGTKDVTVDAKRPAEPASPDENAVDRIEAEPSWSGENEDPLNHSAERHRSRDT
mgnify:CR=1 FL=1